VITEIEIEGFKSLEKVHLRLGGFNLLLGANASGKSNFFDALRVLEGIGYGFTIDEVLNGKPKGDTSEVWEGIRGGSPRVSFVLGADRWTQGAYVRLKAKIQSSHSSNPALLTYLIEFSPDEGIVTFESLVRDADMIFTRQGQELATRLQKAEKYLRIPVRQPLLGWEDIEYFLDSPSDSSAVVDCVRALSRMQRVSPS